MCFKSCSMWQSGHTAAIVALSLVILRPVIGSGGIELNPSVLVLGRFDYLPYQASPPFTSRCTDMVDRAWARAAGTTLAFVPTAYWVSNAPDRSTVDGFCYMDGSNKMSTCIPVTQGLIDELKTGLQLCLSLAVARGYKELAIVPHLDEATRLASAWRNTIVFGPLEQYGGWTYEQVLLNPIADALAAVATPSTVIHFTLQGEMSATVLSYPDQWADVAKRVRSRIQASAKNLPSQNIQVGLSWNYNSINLGGMTPPPQVQQASGPAATAGRRRLQQIDAWLGNVLPLWRRPRVFRWGPDQSDKALPTPTPTPTPAASPSQAQPSPTAAPTPAMQPPSMSPTPPAPQPTATSPAAPAPARTPPPAPLPLPTPLPPPAPASQSPQFPPQPSAPVPAAPASPALEWPIFTKLLAPSATVTPAIINGTSPRQPRPSGPLNIDALKSLISSLDFVGISAYAAFVHENFPLDELQNSAFTFCSEFKSVTGIDMANMMQVHGIDLHYSEFGLGGGVTMDGLTPAHTARQAALHPFFGVFPKSYLPSLDPWHNPRVARFMKSFWTKTLTWLAQGTGPSFSVSKVFMWTLGSYDVLAIYPESTSPAGSYLQPDVANAIKTHNNKIVGRV